MSVLECDRNGCGAIMCDRYGVYGGVGYRICEDCFNELVALGPGFDVEVFMDTPLGSRPDRDVSREYWEEIFPQT